MAADCYTRITMFMGNEMDRPLEDDDAVTLMGAELTVRHHNTVMAQGIVTSARVVDGGSRLQVVIEAGGRSCPACGMTYPAGQASWSLAPLSRVYVSLPNDELYRDIPLWVKVCSDTLGCRLRAAGRNARMLSSEPTKQ